jgi:hypothetical protein
MSFMIQGMYSQNILKYFHIKARKIEIYEFCKKYFHRYF